MPEKSRKNMKYRNRFLYVPNLNKQWRLVPLSTFNARGENFLEIAITETYIATAHDGIKKTMKALTNKFECQSLSQLVKEYNGRRNIGQTTKYLHKGPIRYVTPLHMPIRP